MSFIGFNGKGYNCFVAESTDLVQWTNPSWRWGLERKATSTSAAV